MEKNKGNSGKITVKQKYIDVYKMCIWIISSTV